MAVTSKQIADIAGVSRGTVDRVLNNRSGVKKETKIRIRRIAEQLGYVPNRAGKALSSLGRPIILGLILNSEGNPFYDDILRGIQAAKAAYPDFCIEYKMKKMRGYHVEQQIAALEELTASGIQALIITPINSGLIAQKINEVVASGIEVITLNTDIESANRLAHVGCNYIASGKTAAGLMGLFTNGDARVAIVTGSVNMLGHNQRIQGFLESIQNEYPNMKYVGMAENNDDDIQSYNVVKQLLKAHPEITAFYFAAAGVYGGVKAITECRADNMPIILSCDDVEQTKHLVKSGQIQATVCQEPYRQGLESVRIAVEYLITAKKPVQSVIYMENQIKIAQNIEPQS